MKKTQFPLKYRKKFAPAREYTHTFYSDVKNVHGHQLITLPEDNVHNCLYREAMKYVVF